MAKIGIAASVPPPVLVFRQIGILPPSFPSGPERIRGEMLKQGYAQGAPLLSSQWQDGSWHFVQDESGPCGFWM